MRNNLKGSLLLLSAAFVWGMAFIAQKFAAGSIGVFTFVCARSFITCLVLILPCIALTKARHLNIKKHIVPGCVMGVLSFGAIAFQQWGLEYTTAGKSGFVTSLYIVIVPFLGLMTGGKITRRGWLGAALALGGVALLSINVSEGISVGVGELMTLGCAVVFSGHIIYISRHAGGLDPVILCFIQFAVSMVIGFIGMAIFEEPSVAQIKDSIWSILYVGAISGAVGYTLQIFGQRYTEPALASLVMCMESVFGAIGGCVIGNETLSVAELFGCALMLSGCIIAQLRPKPRGLAS